MNQSIYKIQQNLILYQLDNIDSGIYHSNYSYIFFKSHYYIVLDFSFHRSHSIF